MALKAAPWKIVKANHLLLKEQSANMRSGRINARQAFLVHEQGILLRLQKQSGVLNRGFPLSTGCDILRPSFPVLFLPKI